MLRDAKIVWFKFSSKREVLILATCRSVFRVRFNIASLEYSFSEGFPIASRISNPELRKAFGYQGIIQHPRNKKKTIITKQAHHALLQTHTFSQSRCVVPNNRLPVSVPLFPKYRILRQHQQHQTHIPSSQQLKLETPTRREGFILRNACNHHDSKLLPSIRICLTNSTTAFPLFTTESTKITRLLSS